MSYIEHSLGRSETLLYRARFPWIYAACAWALLIGSLAASIWTYALGYNEVALGLIAVGVVLFVAIMLPLWTTEIGVTNQRFIFKRGLVWRSTQELQLRAIEEVNLEQDLLGRIFDCGRLRVSGTGVDDIRLPLLADPIGLRRALQDGMAAANQAGLVGGPKLAPGAQGAPVMP
ncbi:MAG TPA: PH domain-containing protein [Hyphomicrobiaceae bacterium]|nr:PH domain-containing protein [Hyphomicrobiaceae bacterium]